MLPSQQLYPKPVRVKNLNADEQKWNFWNRSPAQVIELMIYVKAIWLLPQNRKDHDKLVQ